MKKGEIMATACRECGAPAKVAKFFGSTKGMRWVCENGHTLLTCKRTYRVPVGKTVER